MDPRDVNMLFWLAVFLAVYLLPAVISWCRHHRNGAAIFMLNIFLGWTFVGWVAALVWSMTADVKRA